MFGNTTPTAASAVDDATLSERMDISNRLEYRVGDLATPSVTLFPGRAQVTRELKHVTLKSGANQITIVGFSPTVDEHSIKVEGTVNNSVIITDISVESRPNREIFQDTYPDSDDDESDHDSEHETVDESGPKEEEHEDLKAISDKITLLRDEEKRAKEIVASAESRLKILDSYGRWLPTGSEGQQREDIQAGLETYRTEREKAFDDHMTGTVKERDLTNQLAALQRESSKLSKALDKKRSKELKAKEKARRAKQKEKEKEDRKKNEHQKEKARIRRDRESFWPKNVYRVTVTLEAADFTPMTSRRSSVSEDQVKLAAETPDKPVASSDESGTATCDLTLSYITNHAYWSPSYDLALATTTNSGTLCFDARLVNQTSETWTNCKFILSTSQAEFSGLDDQLPSLVPWRVRLAGKNASGSYDNITYSKEEGQHKAGWLAQQNARSHQQPRYQMFGLQPTEVRKDHRAAAEAFAKSRQQPHQQAQVLASRAIAQRPQIPGGLYGSGPNQIPASGGLFGSNITQASTGGGLFGGASNARGTTSAFEAAPEEAAEDPETQPELEYQESSFEETGLTSTYELPGLKTLAPSFTASKQRVARITFSRATFSHTVVAKYKPAAYLKAKLHNGSKLTLLKGPAGLTLDGSFMGRTTIPRCSPGDSFSLSLGVDPAIRVAYPKPEVKRSQTGLFSKEDSGIYSRTITLSNTRSGDKGKPVQLTVLDQVPVSEDERLRIEIVRPRGLLAGGAGVAAGEPGKDGKEAKEWGKAAASLKKEGEVAWNVTLNAGRTVKLGLEYECSFPAGDHVANV